MVSKLIPEISNMQILGVRVGREQTLPANGALKAGSNARRATNGGRSSRPNSVIRPAYRMVS
jgi:hypothetical protein